MKRSLRGTNKFVVGYVEEEACAYVEKHLEQPGVSVLLCNVQGLSNGVYGRLLTSESK